MTVKQINVNQIENHMSEQLSPYISERLDDQISWYGKKSAYNKLRFRICQLIIIVASAVIPIINLGIPLTEVDPIQVLRITAILGGVITIVTALSQMDAYFETWVLYGNGYLGSTIHGQFKGFDLLSQAELARCLAGLLQFARQWNAHIGIAHEAICLAKMGNRCFGSLRQRCLQTIRALCGGWGSQICSASRRGKQQAQDRRQSQR